MTDPAPILFVHDGEDWIRGSERCLLDLIGHIDRRRFLPVVWCTSAVLADAVRQQGIEAHLGHGWEAAAAARWPDRALAREARALIRRHGIRLVHANAVGPVKWLIPAARAACVPIVAHMHNPSDHVERRLAALHQVSLVVGVSSVTTEGFLDDGLSANAVRVIYNGIDLERIARGDARALRDELAIPSDAVVVAHVGSLIPRKGVDVVLRAHASLRRRGHPEHLLIIGSGPELQRLERLATDLEVRDSTHFLGERQAVGAILRDATDIFVSAARSEAFPLTLLEAALMGRPVVASDIPAHRESVVDGETGILVPRDDVEALAAAVESLVADPVRRARFGAAGRERARRDFVVERYVARFEGAYEMLLARPRWSYGWFAGWRWPRAYWRWLGDMLRRRLTRRPAQIPGSEPDASERTRSHLPRAVQER